MCRVIGITNFSFARHQKIVERFCRLAKSGVVMAGDPPGHLDGWGLALYHDGKLIVHKSGTNILAEIDQVNNILNSVQGSPVMILHLRKSAWSNSSTIRHAHPFYYMNTVFFHNGVIYDYKDLVSDISLPGFSQEALDTEVFFSHFMSQKGSNLSEKFFETVKKIKQNHQFSALNSIYSDGVKLYAYRDYAKEPDYYTLYKAKSDHSWFISSECLNELFDWNLMKNEEFLIIDV
jgi:glutamine amidotransferase